MKNLYKKLACVMKDVAYIQKDKMNTFQNYKYASEAAIKEKFHEAFVRHGLLFFLEITDSMLHRDIMNTVKSADQKSNLMVVDFDYTIADVESGETFKGTFRGSGTDTGDKALYKAITGALKYILTSTFLVATGDDPEEDEVVKEVKKSFGGTEQKIPVNNANPLMDEPPFPTEPPPVEYVPGIQTEGEMPLIDKVCMTCSKKFRTRKPQYNSCYECSMKGKNSYAP